MSIIEWYLSALAIATILAFVIAISLYHKGHKYLDWKNDYGDVVHCYKCNRDLQESELTRSPIIRRYGKDVTKYEYIHARCSTCNAMKNYTDEPMSRD
jgi:hypothetical protein